MQPAIHIHPNPILVDEQVTIRLTGFPPGEPVTIKAVDSGVLGGEFPHRYLHLDYQNVGHGIRFPYIPTTNLRLNGGTAKTNAHAAKDSWHHILEFLEQLSD
jgi:BAAT / Acyl-CoA thioester hydrolase C terminal